MGDIVMSNEEINQVEIFERLKRREIKQGKAGDILGISVRQIKRKLRKYKLDGAKSLIHKSRGRTSNRKISQEKIDKYNIDKVTSFIKTMLADLVETYKKSNISQIKVLLGSIFPTGVSWKDNGTLNHKISPIYQVIKNFDKGGIPSGGGDAFYFEPLLVHFNKLMIAYQIKEEGDSDVV